MHNLCMATKTISLKLEAYEKLKAVRRYPDESFTQVVLRGEWPQEPITGGELLERSRRRGPFFSEEELDRIEDLKANDAPPEDKWRSS